VYGTIIQPVLCWCAVKKLPTHSLTHARHLRSYSRPPSTWCRSCRPIANSERLAIIEVSTGTASEGRGTGGWQAVARPCSGQALSPAPVRE